MKAEDPFRQLFFQNPIPMWIFDTVSLQFLEVNESAINNYGYSRDEFLAMTIEEIRPTKEVQRLQDLHSEVGIEYPTHYGYWLHQKKDNSLLHVEIQAKLIDYGNYKAKLVTASDRTHHVLAEQEILKTNERYAYISKATFNATWDWDLVNRTVEWNDIVKPMFGYEREEMHGLNFWHEKLHPEDKERVIKKMFEHIKNRLPLWQDEYRLQCADGSYKYILDRGFTIYDEQNKPVRMIGAMQDLTYRINNEIMLKELNVSLEKRARELAASNEELERFAYVASHDLQEPLRMVTSFLQLIEKKYKAKLDEKAHEYIAFAVDGAERMKGLILDLLEYSRVNTSKEEREEVNTEEIVTDLKRIYKQALKETGGVIEHHGLPVIHGSKTQVTQLFQNLIGNALKYKSEASPVIKIAYKDEGTFYKFSIADNGIGIDPRFFHKIFIIFQRLHNREQFSGTGIGLAICKKIVERHGGQITVTSEPGKGSIFYFTLPK
jgi:PAS domain S-box-containing protein